MKAVHATSVFLPTQQLCTPLQRCKFLEVSEGLVSFEVNDIRDARTLHRVPSCSAVSLPSRFHSYCQAIRELCYASGSRYKICAVSAPALISWRPLV